MTKKIRKQEAKYHLSDMKMSFLSSLVSGVDKHLKTPKGTIVFSRLNDKKKNDRFRNHILEDFAKRSTSAISNINHSQVLDTAEGFQKKYLAAATRHVDKIAKQGENFDHGELLMNTFSAFESVHDKLVDKL